MPKRKVDILQGLRLELNETERKALEYYTTSAVIRNVGTGVGAVAKPVLDNLAYIMGAIVLTDGISWFSDQKEIWDNKRDQRLFEIETARYEDYLATTTEDPPLNQEEWTAINMGDGSYFGFGGGQSGKEERWYNYHKAIQESPYGILSALNPFNWV